MEQNGRTAGLWRLLISTGLGFAVGLVLVALRDQVIPEQFSRDSQKIWRIANLVDPDFVDQSFTPVATIYRSLGLADQPTLAAFIGYLLASLVILLALYSSGRTTASYPLAVFIFGAFLLSAIYLGQYSKDVFVLPVVALLLVLPRRIWWDLVALAAIAVYAQFFRDYWWLVLIAYVAYRILTLRQVRVRYLLVVGAFGAVVLGLGLWLALGRSPNYYREQIIANTRMDVDTQFIPFTPIPQPGGGAIDVFVTYWLVIAPVLLPVTAGLLFAVVAVGIAFTRLYPLVAVRSAIRWPDADTRDGAILRRSLVLLLAFGAVQALFEPDYGSTLRHLTPMLPLAIALVQAARSGTPRVGASPFWTWSGAPRPVSTAETAPAAEPVDAPRAER